jgi:mono/diheme cytochrome c family protein
MHTGFLHLHKTAVILFLALYLLKLAALLLGVNSLKELFARKALRISEMVISTLFLFTGIYLMVSLPAEQRSTLLWIKVAMVLVSIPIAVVGFKRQNKLLATLSVLLVVMSYGLAEMHKKNPAVSEETKDLTKGADIYAANCTSCHGADGAAGLAGAKNLAATTLSDAELEAVIANGKGGMQAYKSKLTAEQIKALVVHIRTLKK